MNPSKRNISFVYINLENNQIIKNRINIFGWFKRCIKII